MRLIIGVSAGEHELPFNPVGKGTGEGRQEEAEARQEFSLRLITSCL